MPFDPKGGSNEQEGTQKVGPVYGDAQESRREGPSARGRRLGSGYQLLGLRVLRHARLLRVPPLLLIPETEPRRRAAARFLRTSSPSRDLHFTMLLQGPPIPPPR